MYLGTIEQMQNYYTLPNFATKLGASMAKTLCILDASLSMAAYYICPI